MGLVARQSFRNLITTYLGFAIGAVNTLFLYVQIFSQEYYGLVGFLLSAATILMPLMAFGVHNTLVKFYSAYTGQNQDSFLTGMLIMPLILIIPICIVAVFTYEDIVLFLTTENKIAAPYIPLIFFIGVSMAYFEVFYSWARVQLQSVLGNFMREVFHRVGVMILLICVAVDLMSTHQFLYGLLAIYILRMLIMMAYAFKLRKPRLRLIGIPRMSRIVKYSLLIIVAGSIAVMILEIDMFMIGKMVPIENVAFYAVAIYIAAVIAVPARAMHQITYPLTAQYLNERRNQELRDLYQKSSITLFIIAGLIFLLIACNIKQLYTLLDPAYSQGLYVVLLISLAKLLENLMGNNNAILYNSDYYRLVLILGVALVVLAILLNTFFIPWLGINGAAIATFIASAGYAVAKIIVVYKKFNMQPFTSKSGSVALLIMLFIGLFYFWDFKWNAFLSIAIKGTLISILYIVLIYKLKFSKEINGVIEKFIIRKTRFK